MAGLFDIDYTRPKLANPDGSFSTERTITVEADGRHYLLPTIVGGRQLTPDDAVSAWKSGANKPVGVFGSAQEADAAARARSTYIGQQRGPQMAESFDFGALLEDPMFTTGLSLLGGAREANPWAAAQQQMQRWSTVQQQAAYKRMQQQLQEAQLLRAQEDAAERKRVRDFGASYDPNMPLDQQIGAGIQAGAISPETAILMRAKQQETRDMFNLKALEAAITREDNQAAKAELQAKHDEMVERIASANRENQRAMRELTAGIGRGNAALLDQLRLAQIGDIQSRQADRELAREEKKALATDRATERFANELQQNKVPSVAASVRTLNETLSNYDAASLPGVGYAKNLPGASFFLTEEGKRVKSQAQAVANDLLNMYSGLAVTLPESERRSLEQMSSGQFNAKDFYNAWPTAVNRLNATVGNLTAGYGPKVTQQYASRPGAMPLAPLTPASGEGRGAAGSAPPKAQRQAGQVYDTPRGKMTWTGTGWLPAN